MKLILHHVQTAQESYKITKELPSNVYVINYHYIRMRLITNCIWKLSPTRNVVAYGVADNIRNLVNIGIHDDVYYFIENQSEETYQFIIKWFADLGITFDKIIIKP